MQSVEFGGKQGGWWTKQIGRVLWKTAGRCSGDFDDSARRGHALTLRGVQAMTTPRQPAEVGSGTRTVTEFKCVQLIKLFFDAALIQRVRSGDLVNKECFTTSTARHSLSQLFGKNFTPGKSAKCSSCVQRIALWRWAVA